jgi:hypothetical protein
MVRAFFAACVFQVAVATAASAGGPYGTIHVGNWMGGAYTNDSNGAFSHCAAGSDYESGVSLIVSQTATGSWLLGLASQKFGFKQGDRCRSTSLSTASRRPGCLPMPTRRSWYPPSCHRMSRAPSRRRA